MCSGVNELENSRIFLCSSTESVPSSSISPKMRILFWKFKDLKFSREARILVGFALYASIISVLRSVLTIWERLFVGVYSHTACTDLSKGTLKEVPMHNAARTLSAL